jgi:hypothetical protein
MKVTLRSFSRARRSVKKTGNSANLIGELYQRAAAAELVDLGEAPNLRLGNGNALARFH